MIEMMMPRSTGMLFLFLVGEVFLLNHQVAPIVCLSNLTFYVQPLSQIHWTELLKLATYFQEATRTCKRYCSIVFYSHLSIFV